MALLASRFTLPSRSQNNFSSRNRDSPGNDAAADCEPIATATMLILARLGLRDCSQTAAARWSLTPSGSGSFTPLRYAAAPDPGARAPAAPLRSVPQPESGGDRAEMLAALARAADRVGAIKTNPQTRHREQLATRRGWHEGPADATLLTAFRGWASALLPVFHTTHIVRSFHSFLVPHLYSFRADTPRSRVPFCTE